MLSVETINNDYDLYIYLFIFGERGGGRKEKTGKNIVKLNIKIRNLKLVGEEKKKEKSRNS